MHEISLLTWLRSPVHPKSITLHLKVIMTMSGWQVLEHVWARYYHPGHRTIHGSKSCEIRNHCVRFSSGTVGDCNLMMWLPRLQASLHRDAAKSAYSEVSVESLLSQDTDFMHIHDCFLVQGSNSNTLVGDSLTSNIPAERFCKLFGYQIADLNWVGFVLWHTMSRWNFKFSLRGRKSNNLHYSVQELVCS